MKNDKEYQLSKAIATYLKYQYPKILYHFDITGSNLSKAQAGRLKAIQGGRGFPDLQILSESKNKKWCGLFLELKKESPYLKDGLTLKACNHIQEQAVYHEKLRKLGYAVFFVWSFDYFKYIIDTYLNEYNDNELF